MKLLSLVRAARGFSSVSLSTSKGSLGLKGRGEFLLFGGCPVDTKRDEQKERTYLTRHLEDALKRGREVSVEHGDELVFIEPGPFGLLKTRLFPVLGDKVEYFTQERAVSRATVQSRRLRSLKELVCERVRITVRAGSVAFKGSRADGEESVTIECDTENEASMQCGFAWFSSLEKVLPEMDAVLFEVSPHTMSIRGVFNGASEEYFELQVPALL
jgi:hypothetical protein